MAKYKNQEQLTKWLSDAIMTEMKKPVDEINVEFVDSCEALLNTLMGEPQLTDSEIQKRIDKIMKKKGSKVRKPRFLRTSKKILAASIAIFIIFSAGITLYAFNPTFRDVILKALHLEIGQSKYEDGLTYEYKGKAILYDTIEELIEKENLDIVYPTQCAYDAQITEIIRTESNDITLFSFSNSKINMMISHNTTMQASTFENTEVINYNYTFYITSKPGYYIAYAIINEDLYTIKCDTKENLLLMLNSFN